MSKLVDLGPDAYQHYIQDVKRYLADPLLALRELVGIGLCTCNNGKPCHLDPKQKEIILSTFRIMRAKLKAGADLEHIKEEADKLGVLVQSAKGTGKTAIAALICLLFMFCMPMCKVFLVGPKEDQIKSGIWPEIAKWFGHATKVYGENNILNRMFDMPGEIIYSRVFLPEKSMKKEWVTRILTFPKNSDEEMQKAAIQGKHEKFMLFVLEECPGIPNYIFEAIQGTCTDPTGVNICLGIFNPNKNTGWAIEGMKDSKTWTPIQISALDSSLVSRSFIEMMARRYGVESNAYRVGVLGLPPLSSSDGMFPWDWLVAAEERYLDFVIEANAPVIFGCDIGGGGDDSVVCVRKGPKVERFFKKEAEDSNVISAWIESLILEHKPVLTVIDKNGLGHGVFCNLSHLPGVIGFNSKNRAHNPDKFDMMRDQVFWRLREAYQNGDIAVKDEELKGELSVLTYSEIKGGLISVVSKSNAEFKKELQQAVGYRSPNKADALAMTFYRDYSNVVRDIAHRQSTIRRKQEIYRGPLSWMGA